MLQKKKTTKTQEPLERSYQRASAMCSCGQPFDHKILNFKFMHNFL
jgi:hypothetical protein